MLNVLGIVHGADSSFGIGLLAVANETEATAATSVSVLDYDLSDIPSISRGPMTQGITILTYSFLNGAELLEFLTKSNVIGVPGKATEDVSFDPS